MPKRDLDPNNLGHDEDWQGNNAAFKCPQCGKVYLVSGSRVHGGERKCPGCGKSVARISRSGGRQSGGTASIEWSFRPSTWRRSERAGRSEQTQRLRPGLVSLHSKACQSVVRLRRRFCRRSPASGGSI